MLLKKGLHLPTSHKQRGVTLIELLIAITIVGVLYMLAAPSYGAWIQNQQIRTAAESILNGIQMTRSEAVKNSRRASFVLCDLPASSWEVLAVSAAAPAPVVSLVCGSNPGAGVIRVQERSGREGSRLAQVVVTPAGATTITFNGIGRVVANADATPFPVTEINVSTPTGNRPLRITLGAGGNTRMCDPSPLLSATDPRHCP